MKSKVILAGCLFMLLGSISAWAQPKARAARDKQKTENAEPGMSVRAQYRYPRSKELPQDLVWMREVYRTLDLTKDANGALYFPAEPTGDRKNLFSTIFKLLGQKKISAYEYQLDGTERFTKDNKVNLLDVLDRFQIYYERREVEGRKEPALVIENSDVPSADVKSYFIKEVWYFDRRTSTYGSTVTALCPVLHRTEEFSTEPMKLPMFWVDYKELAPYMNDVKVMTSNLNNLPNSTLDDFFLSRKYTGEIYKTTNLQNQALSQYCPNDSALHAEQTRIEKELADVESYLFGVRETPKEEQVDKKEKVEKTDESVSVEESQAATEEKKEVRKNSKKPKNSGKSSSSKKKVKTAKPKGSSANAPKASVRRQRR